MLFRKTGGGKLYRLVGLASFWLGSLPILRAEPANLCEAWLR